MDDVYLRLAFAARYGHMGLEVTLHLPGTQLAQFNSAIGRLIEEENRSGRTPTED